MLFYNKVILCLWLYLIMVLFRQWHINNDFVHRMPPKRKGRPAVARGGASLCDDPGPPPAGRSGGGDTVLPPLPDTFHAALGRLVGLVCAAVDDSVTMFKLEMASVPAAQSVADVVAGLSTKTQQGLCEVTPLFEVRPSDLPANGCSGLFDHRQYAEALLHATRAHFAFVEFDSRLIYTSTAGVRDPTAASQLLYIFSYVKPTGGRTGAVAVRTSTKVQDGREVSHRRRTVAVVPRPDDGDDDLAESSIGDELERYRDKLDRVERSLLEASQSIAEEDMRLPETALDSSLDDVPAPALGTALHAVLPRVQAAAATTKRATTKQNLPRGAISHPAITAAAARATRAAPAAAPVVAPAAVRAAPAAARRGKRRRSLSPAPTAPDAIDSAPAAPAEPSTPATGPPTPSRQTVSHLPSGEADQLVAFFQKLNGSQTEQSRVSLTCRYAKMRYGHDVPSGVVYRLVETARRQGDWKEAAADPAKLTGDDQREAALAVFAELDTNHTEQSRVAYTLQYMRVQHSARLNANTLFGWLGQGAKKPSAKKAKLR